MRSVQSSNDLYRDWKTWKYNMPIDDVENINSTNKGRDLLLTNEPQIVPWRTERILQRIQIDQHILNESKTRRKNLAITWIDYKKAYMVPQSWIINCLKIYKILDEVINFIGKTMKTWRLESTAGGKSLAEVNIQRGIFQGDALSPLLFIIAIMPLNHKLTKFTAGYKLNKL